MDKKAFISQNQNFKNIFFLNLHFKNNSVQCCKWVLCKFGSSVKSKYPTNLLYLSTVFYIALQSKSKACKTNVQIPYFMKIYYVFFLYNLGVTIDL